MSKVTNQKLLSLKDAINTLTDQIDDFQQMLDDLTYHRRREKELEREIARLEDILDEYGIDRTETRQYRIDAVQKFIEGLGI